MMQQQRQARSIKPVVRRTGMVKLTFHLERIQRNITERPWRALSIVIAVAVGVSIAITIIAASDGIDTKINSIVNGPNVNADAANQAGINITTIHDVLTQ